MSNSKEGYALITNQGYIDHVSEMWPNSIGVGDNYKLCTYAIKDESRFTELVNSLGFECKFLTAQETIDNMNNLELGPFIVYGDDIHVVVNHFNNEINQ